MAHAMQPLSSEIESLRQVFNLIEAFRAFDANNDGFITTQELGGILSSLGYKASVQQAKEIMRNQAKTKNGLLSIQEFLEMNTEEFEFGNRIASYLSSAIEALDEDVDEVVNANELFECVKNLGINLSLQDCQAIVASIDGDGDGAVKFEDIKLILDALL